MWSLWRCLAQGPRARSILRLEHRLSTIDHADLARIAPPWAQLPFPEHESWEELLAVARAAMAHRNGDVDREPPIDVALHRPLRAAAAT